MPNRVDRTLRAKVRVAAVTGLWFVGLWGSTPVTAAEPPPSISADHNSLAVGRDLNTGGGNVNITGLDEEKLVAVLEARGFLRTAEAGGLERQTIITLAQRLKPEDTLDFDQAIRELERAVEVALDVIARGERGTSEDDFVNVVLAQVAERTRNDDLDGAAQALDDALAELDRQEAAAQQRRVAILEAGVRQHTLRRDASAVAGRIEMLVAVDQPTERPAWLPAFRKRYDAFYEDGKAKGINFSLSVAIELARRMVATAHGSTERGIAANLLGNALWSLGERESRTALLEQAAEAHRAAL